MKRRASALCAAVVGGLLLAPAAAQAHGLVGRIDLPIPRYLFAWAAAIVLVVSFVGLATLWPRPRLEGEPARRRLVAVPPVVDWLAGALGVGLFGLVVYSGLAGTKTATANLAPTFVYVIFWVGLAFLSGIFGDVFRALNPWRAVARLIAWVASRVASKGLPEPLPYPQWLGRWPAVAGILGFAWLELVYTNRTDPTLLALLGLGYAAIQLVGMSLYGIEPWSSRGDAFSVYFGMFARLSPFERRDGVLYLRPPLSGTTSLDRVPGTVALLCVMIGTTSFDGFSQGSLWSQVAPDVQHFFVTLGANLETALELAFTVGLIGAVAFISGIYRLGVLGMRSVAEGPAPRELAGRFVHSLIPIALAYVVAHYFSLLVYQGQVAPDLLGNPLGHGLNAGGSIDYNVISATGIWYVQVAALVIGHVCGLVVAHDRALISYPTARLATRSQYWMLAVMIGFTSLGLWILSSTNT
ncbi:MAG TPA: fenitrothion hydrolase [Solirubrobacteraceae bacterium]|nr:fenitrothion hydrolase [Solirubrobacteraceae bacterium]